MAHVKNIWIFESDKSKKQFSVSVLLKPAGQVDLKFEMPDGFFDCLFSAAQAAADLHEQQMRAEILADNEKGE